MIKLNKRKSMKISLINHGCAKNLVDAELILGILTEKGYQVTLYSCEKASLPEKKATPSGMCEPGDDGRSTKFPHPQNTPLFVLAHHSRRFREKAKSRRADKPKTKETTVGEKSPCP